MISNTGYTGAGGFEIYVGKEHALKVWNAIFEAGKASDIKPIGLGARDTLRLEMGFCLYGNDIDDTTSPLEAGLGWITKFTKEFTNSANLKKQKEEGVKKKLVGFKMIDRGIPRHDYVIKDTSGNSIGKVTSGTMSPMLGIGVGLGYVTTAHSSPGSEIYIDVRGKMLKAECQQVAFNLTSGMKAICAVVLFSIWLEVYPQSSQKEVKINNKAVALMDGEQYKEALPFLDDLVARDSVSTIYRYNRAVTLFNLKKYRQALADYEILSAAAVPEESEYVFQIGNAYEQLDSAELAIDFYTKAIRLENDKFCTIFKRGTLYLTKREIQ